MAKFDLILYYWTNGFDYNISRNSNESGLSFNLNETNFSSIDQKNYLLQFSVINKMHMVSIKLMIMCIHWLYKFVYYLAFYF